LRKTGKTAGAKRRTGRKARAARGF